MFSLLQTQTGWPNSFMSKISLSAHFGRITCEQCPGPPTLPLLKSVEQLKEFTKKIRPWQEILGSVKLGEQLACDLVLFKLSFEKA